MSVLQRVTGEVKALGLISLYFASWFGVMILLKRLVLAEHQIEFRSQSLAIVGALIVAKVVVVMEHVPLGRWTRRHDCSATVTRTEERACFAP